MDKQAVIDYVKGWYGGYRGFTAESALEAAKAAGLISSFKLVESTITGERRWGHDEEIVFSIDESWHLCVFVYVTTMDEGEDECEGAIEVTPEEVTVIHWKAVE